MSGVSNREILCTMVDALLKRWNIAQWRQCELKWHRLPVTLAINMNSSPDVRSIMGPKTFSEGYKSQTVPAQCGSIESRLEPALPTQSCVHCYVDWYALLHHDVGTGGVQ